MSVHTLSGTFPIKFAAVNVATSGDSVLVAGKPGYKYRVMEGYMGVAAASAVKFKSGAGTDITGAIPLAANGGFSFDTHAGLCETAVGQDLVINQTAITALGGAITYIEIKVG